MAKHYERIRRQFRVLTMRINSLDERAKALREKVYELEYARDELLKDLSPDEIDALIEEWRQE